jgi:multiple sugar transport system ATP-binding protein
MHLITLKEVTKKYGGKKVLNKISIDLDIGEFVVVLGKSGVGKSTLLNLLDFL